jgi:hypothetical protein
MKMKTKMRSTKRKKLRKNDYSPASLLITNHYRHVGVNDIWDRNRVQRLLGYLRMSEKELVALLNTTMSAFKACYLRGSISGPCALLLTVLEQTYMGDFVTDSVPNLFDFYGSSRHTREDGNDPSET